MVGHESVPLWGQSVTLSKPIPYPSAEAAQQEKSQPITSTNRTTSLQISPALAAEPLVIEIPSPNTNLSQIRLLPPIADQTNFSFAGDKQPASEIADLAVPGLPAAAASPKGSSISPPSDVFSHSGSQATNAAEIAIPTMSYPNMPAFTPAQQMLAPTATGADLNPAGNLAATATGATAPSDINPFIPRNQPCMDPMGRLVQPSYADFLPSPMSVCPYDPVKEAMVYRGKFAVPTQRPWIEFWRPFYTGGTYAPSSEIFGKTNLFMPHFLVYGDMRTGVGINRNQAGDARSVAKRLNLELDLKLTATERIHAFVGPLDNNGQFSRLDFSDDVRFESEMDFKPDTLFFEGDVGAIAGGMAGVDSWFDLPFTLGLIPLLYQNGIWMEDAIVGAAWAIPARHSTFLDWSNFDATFFMGFDQITSDAFAGNNSAAQIYGTAWFIEAYGGYIEADYAFLNDDDRRGRSYHNASLAFTRRYFARISNSIRLISNFGQNGPTDQRTADGVLLLLENSLVTAVPNTFVPYVNFFYGSGKPQSAARAAGSGGILRNTGINFESDGLTGYPTLDATGFNTYGVAMGLNIMGASFGHQLVAEVAALGAYGNGIERTAPGDQYATGLRYQKPLNNAWLIRLDGMYGFLQDSDDIAGGRAELRWKF